MFILYVVYVVRLTVALHPHANLWCALVDFPHSDNSIDAISRVSNIPEAIQRIPKLSSGNRPFATKAVTACSAAPHPKPFSAIYSAVSGTVRKTQVSAIRHCLLGKRPVLLAAHTNRRAKLLTHPQGRICVDHGLPGRSRARTGSKKALAFQLLLLSRHGRPAWQSRRVGCGCRNYYSLSNRTSPGCQGASAARARPLIGQRTRT